jgi:hypothetical protein
MPTSVTVMKTPVARSDVTERGLMEREEDSSPGFDNLHFISCLWFNSGLWQLVHENAHRPSYSPFTISQFSSIQFFMYLRADSAA